MDLVNNKVTLLGEVEDKPVISHTVNGEQFYTTSLSVARRSGVIDSVPILFSERIQGATGIVKGDILDISGRMASFNFHDENGNAHLIVSVFCNEIYLASEVVTDDYANSVELEGFICREPNYRKTPLGREICDVLVAVNRPYRKSDYIPCVVWGRNAQFTNGLSVGDKVSVVGRFQSRNYSKKYENETVEKVAYEVSVSTINLLEVE